MMTDLTFDILRSAVTLAKNEQIEKVSRLKARLLDIYPNNQSEIDAAIQAWARYATRAY